MKVIMPVAGKGTRLLPVTATVPKPLVHVGGRPVMDYVVDALSDLDVEELIFITGHLKDQVERHVTQSYAIPARFVEQEVQDGTAGAINLARPYVDGPVLIVFVDTLFDADLSLARRTEADGIIWVKEVEDYQRFGVVVTDGDGYMTRIVEKPSEPISKRANVGLYYVRAWEQLFEGIADTLARPANRGEWYLTDAFQYMIDQGARIATADVAGWYDCGKLDTLLETNHHLLATTRGRAPTAREGVTVIEPVHVADDAVLEAATVGPNVTVEAGATVRRSVVRHAIVGAGARIEDATIDGALVGPGAVVTGVDAQRIIASGGQLVSAP